MKGGGAERVISHLMGKLNEDYEIHLILLDLVFDYKVPSDVKIYKLSSIWKRNNIFNILQIPFLAWQLIKYLKSHHIESCVSFLNRPNWINGFTKFYNTTHKVIISERTTPGIYYDTTTFSGKIGIFLIKYLYPKADVIIPNSKGVKYDLEKLLDTYSNYHVIYNPVHLPLLVKDRQEEKEFFTFIFVARFQYPKDHITILKAFSAVYKKHSKIKLLFLGEGENEANCKEIAKVLGIQYNVAFLGFDNTPQQYLNQADCFLFSSFFEGFPNVVLEAMACSLPVISTDCFSGPREIISPNTDYSTLNNNKVEVAEYGILVPVGNEELMSIAMEAILLDSKLHNSLSLSSYQRAQHFYGLDYIQNIKSIL